MPHQAVLLEPAIRMLKLETDGLYVDATFGRGGHAAAILQRLGPEGRLYAIDRDREAVEWGQEKILDPRFAIKHGSFDRLSEFCEDWEIKGRVNGLLFDLGVSSPQLDDRRRGFSFMQDGPLDMRMDTSVGMSAAEWLAVADEQEIAEVIWKYGEERNSRKIAKRIKQMQSREPIVTTEQLASLVSSVTPQKKRHKHPATRTFQAIRIFINREITILESVLTQVTDVLCVGGRLVMISFHSLEDRVVKRFLREQGKPQPYLPKGLPVKEIQIRLPLRPVGKAMRSNEEEVNDNIRARSAIMRVAERVL